MVFDNPDPGDPFGEPCEKREGPGSFKYFTEKLVE